MAGAIARLVPDRAAKTGRNSHCGCTGGRSCDAAAKRRSQNLPRGQNENENENGTRNAERGTRNGYGLLLLLLGSEDTQMCFFQSRPPLSISEQHELVSRLHEAHRDLLL